MNDICLKLGLILTTRQWKMASCESCTGGMIATRCTDISGSSTWFERGLITYSNQAKEDLLGVGMETIKTLGAVSEKVAIEMVEGVFKRAPIHAALATTGIAGPDGGSNEKPVGTVWFAWKTPQSLYTKKKIFTGNRSQIREQASQYALEKLCTYISIT